MHTDDNEVPLSRLGERLSPLRLRSEASLQAMKRSLSQRGQLSALLCYQDASSLEVLDGFKRLSAARALGWTALRVHCLTGDAVEAKLALWQVHAGSGLSELEEAWLLRSLHRDDGLPQHELARCLGRHKSWVCRRLMLAECLSEEVEAQLRLGLLSATMARELCRLPRGNQDEVAQVFIERGLTSRQASRLVDSLLATSDEAARQARLAEARGETTPPRHAKRTPGERLLGDAQAIGHRSARLHALLLGQPLAALGTEAAALATHSLRQLQPTLEALCRTIDTILTD